MGWFDWDTNVDTWARDRLRRTCGHEEVLPRNGKSVPVQPHDFNLVDIVGKKLRLRFVLRSYEIDGVEYLGPTEILTCVKSCEVQKAKNGGGQILLHIDPLRVMTKSDQTDTLFAIAFLSPDGSEACYLQLMWESECSQEGEEVTVLDVTIMWD